MSADGRHSIKFVPSGRGKAQCPPDERYPNGVVLDASNGRLACRVDLPYPAPECGIFPLRRTARGATAAITAAGRPDDPISIKLPCQLDPTREAN
jgi:hypothetical protein